MAESGYKYAVYVGDNFHYIDESERYKKGDFATLDEANAACKQMIDGFLKVGVEPDRTAAEGWSSDQPVSIQSVCKP
jgi:hypothetical protein